MVKVRVRDQDLCIQTLNQFSGLFIRVKGVVKVWETFRFFLCAVETAGMFGDVADILRSGGPSRPWMLNQRWRLFEFRCGRPERVTSELMLRCQRDYRIHVPTWWTTTNSAPWLPEKTPCNLNDILLPQNQQRRYPVMTGHYVPSWGRNERVMHHSISNQRITQVVWRVNLQQWNSYYVLYRNVTFVLMCNSSVS